MNQSENNGYSVSIVIPVYNTIEKIMQPCIESVLNQTYKNLEIIIIDDGSSDDNRIYYDTLSDYDSRISVIHKSNNGVSSARNYGTQIAKGEYLCYVDSDDYLEANAIEHMMNCMCNNDVDCVIGAVEIIEYGNTSKIDKTKKNQMRQFREELIESKAFDSLRRNYLTAFDKSFQTGIPSCYIGRGPYARLIKSSIAKQCTFVEGLPIGEDTIWNFDLLSHCSKVVVLYEPVYRYYLFNHGNIQSAVRKYYGNREEIGRKYISELVNRNTCFCKANKDALYYAIMAEWSSLIRYELVSKKCPMSKKEKSDYVKKLTNKYPWSSLFDVRNWKYLAIEDICLIICSKMNVWQFVVTLYNKIRGKNV